MRLTGDRWGLEPGELTTTAIAFAVSTSLYLRDGHPYLARGVLGDLAGFALLGTVLVARRRRLRHEALACLIAILVVLALDPSWPLCLGSGSWWLIFAAGLGGYLLARRRLLPAAQRRAPRAT